MNNSKHKKGLIFVLVGPGGAGKNAIMREVLKDMPALKQLATATTRPQRSTEKHGREHLFINLAEFISMIEENRLLEYQEVTPGKFYGIPKDSVDEAIELGQDLIADIEVLGARILRETYGKRAILVFVTVPGDTIEDKLLILRQRLSNNERQENEQLIQERLERARNLEFPFATEADIIIENDAMENAVAQLKHFIENQRTKIYDVSMESTD